MESQKIAPAYTPFPLIQHIPRLTHYERGDPEFLIVIINDMSETTSHLFQGQMFGCNNGGGGGNFSKVKRFVQKPIGTQKLLFFGGFKFLALPE